ncbi:MAG: 50S ribosomal protein L10 [Actinomycetota bacterium]
MPRAEKEAKVHEIAGELQGAEAAVLAGYRGLTVQDAAELREALVDVDTRFAIVKNSLAMLAVKEAGLEGLVEFFDGPTAVAFVKGDPVTAAKRLVEQSKKFPVIEIRGGFAEGRVLSGDEIRQLAALDSREVMLAKIAGLGKMQMSKAAWMFQALQSKFLLLLEALKEKLPAEDGGAEAPADGRLSEAADAAEAEESPATEEPEAGAEAPAAEVAEVPVAEDNPDAEQPSGGEEEPAESPDEPASEETEPEAPSGSAGDETETEGTEKGGE